MSLDYLKLKPKRFPKKSHKHALEARYWKKFETIPIDTESQSETSNMLRSDLSFCQRDKPNVFASAVAARIEIFRLTTPPSQDEIEPLKPVSKIFKFKDVVTAVQMRQDGNIIVSGEKNGRVQVIELSNKFILKTYEEHNNQINGVAFRDNMKEFMVAANETNVKVFSILEHQSVLTLHNAHSDNVKKVAYYQNDIIVSASADRTVKLWDLRNSSEALASIKLAHGVEDFCKLPSGELVIANGPILTILNLEGNQINRVADYQSFQKPVLRVRWDASRERLLAGGQDQQLKLFSYADSQLKVAYKIKLPQEITCLDVAPDGQHFAVGLANGGLLVKSKMLESNEEELETEEQKMIKNALQSSFVSKAKNYKYFFRGQYSTLIPEEGDMMASIQARKVKLQPFEVALKKFQYKEALNQALQNQQNPEVVLALLEELIERGALEIALAKRSEADFSKLVNFIKWKLPDIRYQPLLVEVARVLLDMYAGPLVFNSGEALGELASLIEQEVAISTQLKQIGGQMDMMIRMASALQPQI